MPVIPEIETVRTLMAQHILGKKIGHVDIYRTGQPCNVCGRPIETKRVGGRNALFCRTCQK